MTSSLALWRDRRGRVSALRIAALVLLGFPIALAANAMLTDGLGARPLNDLIHRTGYWTLVFLLTTLALMPLARIGRFGGLIDVRRMMGVGTSVYAATHISLYIADQMFDLAKVASEIALRLYLTIGFTALILLATLAATSTDGMVRRLGPRRWQRLHRAVYVIAVLALIHFFQQTKADVWVPTFAAGLFVWLMGYRLLIWLRRPQPSAWVLAGLALAASGLTFVGEALGIGLYYGVSPLLVLQTSFDFDFTMIRPGWLVLAVAMCVVLIAILRDGWRKLASARPSPAPASQGQGA
jgi:methionine sulfoxide reductase heme-binding subunit